MGHNGAVNLEIRFDYLAGFFFLFLLVNDYFLTEKSKNANKPFFN